ncbi:MAG: SPOR domain-containing protein [Muribaculaceae bacterium]|nr:SPOR domain-containing protein [Muribaculaceae bacterium]
MRIKTFFIYGILAAALGFPPMSAAQSASEPVAPTYNAIDQIEIDSEGNVDIDIPEDILNMLLYVPQSTGPKQKVEKKKVSTLQKGLNKIKGFRVQVFADGRNQNTLEARVKTRANAISAKMPQYRGQVYTFSSAPNWYCRVGNFQTKEEASKALAELKRAFPSFAGEMRIVNSEVIIVR